MNRRLLPLFLAPIVALSLTACGSGDDTSSAESAAESPMADEEFADQSLAPSGDGDLVQSGNSQPDGTESASSTLIIRASVQMHADEVPATVEKVIAKVSEFSGSVSARNIVNRNPEDPTDAYATMTVRIPPKRAEEFLQALGTVGTVDSIEQSAEDVAGQLVDLDLRIKNAQASVDRIRQLMETTTNIDELTKLESELTARQTALEQLEAQQQGLTSETAMATIDISISSTESLGTPEPTDSSLKDAAASGWNIFIQVLYVLLLIITFALPFIVFGGMIWFIVRWFQRRRKGGDGDLGPTSPGTGGSTGTMPPPAHREHSK